jgi:hypothetical protein
MIYEKAFDHGLRQNGLIMEKGNPVWNSPSLCIKNMSQYMSSISANGSEELFYVSLLCERAQFGGCRRWKMMIQDALLTRDNLKFPPSEELKGNREPWPLQLCSEQHGATTKALRRVQLRENHRCIRMRRKPDDGVRRNPARTGNQYTDRDINWAPGYGPGADATLQRNGQSGTSVDARAEATIRRMAEGNRRLREELESLKVSWVTK